MKKYRILFTLCVSVPLWLEAQTSNVTLTVMSDGTLRAPTNFFGANVERLTNALNSAGYSSGDSTNEINDRLIVVGTELTNRIGVVGTEATNYTQAAGTAITNRIATLGTETTNYTRNAGMATTNAFFANDVVTSNALYTLISAKIGATAALYLLSTNDGSGLTNLNASELRSGTVPAGRLPGTLVDWLSLATNSYINTNVGTVKGDLLVFDGSAWTKIAAGSDNHVLTADSGQSKGVKWASGAAGSPANATPVTAAFESDGTNVFFNASAGTHFDLTLTNNCRLRAPTNEAVNGQVITFRLIQDASGRRTAYPIPATNAAGKIYNWKFGDAITALGQTTNGGAVDYFKAVYNAGKTNWDVVANITGF